MFDNRETRGKRELNRHWSSKSLKLPTLDHSCGCLLGPLVWGSAKNDEKCKNRNGETNANENCKLERHFQALVLGSRSDLGAPKVPHAQLLLTSGGAFLGYWHRGAQKHQDRNRRVHATKWA